MQTSVRGRIAIAVTTLAAVAFGGGAYAATQDSGSVGRQAFVRDAAKRLNLTPEQLEAALHTRVAPVGLIPRGG